MLTRVVYQIRWKDPVLWPGVRSAVPEGFEPVTDRATAHGLMLPHVLAAELPMTRAAHFLTLWHTCLERTMQPSGLMLIRQAALLDVVGHTTPGTVRRWAQFCDRRPLWVYVPGKLHPPLEPGSGTRTRVYLPIRPCTA